MKKLTGLLLAAITLAMSFVTASAATPIKVMTFNIRLDAASDSLNNWKYRRDRAANAINFYAPDIIGMQEVVINQLNDLKERLPEYTAVGVGRDDGKEAGEHMSVFFSKDRWQLLDQGNFWLSETPDEPSLGWDAACRRVATWVKLRDKTDGKEYFMLNTHLDHIGQQARSEGVKLVLDRARRLAGDNPIIVTGDFNSNPESEVVRLITDKDLPGHLNDSRALSPVVYGPSWTWHDFGRLPYAKRELIDYVFISDELQPISYGVLAETEENEFLSDHCPVLVNLIIKP